MPQKNHSSGRTIPGHSAFMRLTVKRFGGLRRGDHDNVTLHLHPETLDGKPVSDGFVAEVIAPFRVIADFVERARAFVSREALTVPLPEAYQDPAAEVPGDQPVASTTAEEDFRSVPGDMKRPVHTEILIPHWMAWIATISLVVCVASLLLWLWDPRTLFSGAAAVAMICVACVIVAGDRYLRCQADERVE